MGYQVANYAVEAWKVEPGDSVLVDVGMYPDVALAEAKVLGVEQAWAESGGVHFLVEWPDGEQGKVPGIAVWTRQEIATGPDSMETVWKQAVEQTVSRV